MSSRKLSAVSQQEMDEINATLRQMFDDNSDADGMTLEGFTRFAEQGGLVDGKRFTQNDISLIYASVKVKILYATIFPSFMHLSRRWVKSASRSHSKGFKKAAEESPSRRKAPIKN
jgi:hypothetical protein